MSSICRTRGAGWPLERALFAMAGTVALASALLAATVSEWFLLLTAFAGASRWLYAAVGVCPASLIVERVAHLRSAIYTDTQAQTR
jgi:hypothetical protein